MPTSQGVFFSPAAVRPSNGEDDKKYGPTPIAFTTENPVFGGWDLGSAAWMVNGWRRRCWYVLLSV